jgi:hypothetical protein
MKYVDTVIGFALLTLLVIYLLGFWATRSAAEKAEIVKLSDFST